VTPEIRAAPRQLFVRLIVFAREMYGNEVRKCSCIVRSKQQLVPGRLRSVGPSQQYGPRTRVLVDTIIF
jgi:hypothetical protein